MARAAAQLPKNRKRRWMIRAAIVACICGGLAGAAFGLAFPLLSLALENRFGSGPIIGWNAAAGAVSTLFGAAATPALVKRFGLRPAVTACALASAALFMAFAAFDSLVAWYVLRFLFGLTATVVFVASETWINHIAPPTQRGRYLGFFAAALASGLGLGAITFALVGRFETLSFAAGAAFFVICAVIVHTPALKFRPSAERTDLSALASAAKAAPIAILAGCAFGAIETAVWNFLPVYAVRLDYAAFGVSALMTAAALGNVVLTAPIGRLADKIGRLRALIGCAAVSTITPLLFVVGPAHLLAYAAPLAFIYAGVGAGLYTVGLARLAERIPASRISQANAAFVVSYGVGSLASPPAAGAMIDVIDPHGLMLTLAAIALFLSAGAVFSAVRARLAR